MSQQANEAVRATQGPEAAPAEGCRKRPAEAPRPPMGREQRGTPRRGHPWVGAFEKEQMRQEPPDYFRNLRVFEALFQEALLLGALPLRDPLEGIDVDIRLAQVIDVHTPS